MKTPTSRRPKPSPASTFELTPDPQNANRGTQRGLALLERSIEKFGAARPVVATADGVIIAGNKTFEAAREKGLAIKIIDSDGRALHVLRRTDLNYADARAREYAVADNRVGQVGLDWDPAVFLDLMADEGALKALTTFFSEDELSTIVSAAPALADAPGAESDLLGSRSVDGRVPFRFGAYNTLVRPETYAAFCERMESERGKDPAVALLCDVIDRIFT